MSIILLAIVVFLFVYFPVFMILFSALCLFIAILVVGKNALDMFDAWLYSKMHNKKVSTLTYIECWCILICVFLVCVILQLLVL